MKYICGFLYVQSAKEIEAGNKHSIRLLISTQGSVLCLFCYASDTYICCKTFIFSRGLHYFLFLRTVHHIEVFFYE